MKLKWSFSFICLIVILSGCGGQTAVSEPTTAPIAQSTATDVPVPTEPPTPELPTAVPTVETAVDSVAVVNTPTTESPTAEPTAEPVSFMQSGRTEDGAYYLGNPNAPIRLIDYSDFL